MCWAASAEQEVQMWVSLGHGLLSAFPLALLLDGVLLRLSFRGGTFPLEVLVTRLVGNVLHPYPPNAEHSGSCGE